MRKNLLGCMLLGIIVFVSLLNGSGMALDCTPWRQTELYGKVLDPAGAPAACCDLEIEVDTLNPTGPFFYYVTTDTDGFYELCVDCDHSANVHHITVRALCCGSEVEDEYESCPFSHEMPDLVCVDEVETDYAIVRGRVECRDPLGLPEGVEGCTVLLQGGCDGGWYEEVTALTDAFGNYEVCFPCPDGCWLPWTLTATSQCCEASDEVTVGDMCPEEIDVPPLVCPGDCPDPPCEGGETLIKGYVTCTEDGSGGETGYPGCNVTVKVWGTDPECEDYLEYYRVETDAGGYYEVCVTCPGCVDWIVEVQANCCQESEDQEVKGCPSEIEMEDIDCGACPLFCDPGWTLVSGYVFCHDGTPIEDCTVSFSSTQCWPPPPFQTQTDENGYYAACLPCDGCPPEFVAWVEAECCMGEGTDAWIDCNAPVNEVPDIICQQCPPEPPCGPNEIEVSGRVVCHEDHHHSPDPIAGCEVLLEAVGCDVAPVITETDGDGYYTACFDCDDCDFFEIVATALCCDMCEVITVSDCPAEADIPDIVCQNCDPCLPDQTRIEGKVVCKEKDGYHGPMVDCPVEITVDTCDGPFAAVTTTDDKGKYRVCVPCACEEDKHAKYEAESLCCEGKKSKKSHKHCKPKTKMKTITCKEGCS